MWFYPLAGEEILKKTSKSIKQDFLNVFSKFSQVTFKIIFKAIGSGVMNSLWEKDSWGDPLFIKISDVCDNFLQVLSPASLPKIFNFSNERKMVSVASRRRWPLQILRCFSDILSTAGKSKTLYEFETLYVQLSRHARITEIFQVFMTPSMSDFYIISQFLSTASVISVHRNSYFLQSTRVSIGSAKFDV